MENGTDENTVCWLENQNNNLKEAKKLWGTAELGDNSLWPHDYKIVKPLFIQEYYQMQALRGNKRYFIIEMKICFFGLK